MDKAFIVLLPLIGVALGWGLTSSTALYKNSKEDKRVKRQILYTLLELHYLLTKLDIENMAELAVDFFLERIPAEQRNEESRQYARLIYTKNTYDVFLPFVENRLSGLEEKYNTTIDTLAKYDPITAYELNGTTKIMEVFDLMRTSHSQLCLQFQEALTEDDNEDITKIMESTQPRLIRVTVEHTQKKILEIAKSINKKVFAKTQTILQQTNSATSVEMKEFIRTMFPNNSDVPAE